MTMMSPRISFSHDLSKSDVVPIEPKIRRSVSSSSVDFDFFTHERFNQETSSADELFCDGKILPCNVKKKIITQETKIPTPPSPPPLPRVEKQNSKSFWRFKRSSSWNCASGYAKSFCSLPLLLRSNSSESPSSVKRSSSGKDGLNHKQHSHRNLGLGSIKLSSGHQKPPLKKSGYGSGVRVNPVLNVPAANFFGLGSIFSGNKDKNRKK